MQKQHIKSKLGLEVALTTWRQMGEREKVSFATLDTQPIKERGSWSACLAGSIWLYQASDKKCGLCMFSSYMIFSKTTGQIGSRAFVFITLPTPLAQDMTKY